MTSLSKFFSLLLFILSLQGCLARPLEDKPRYFWPPYENGAKIEFLNFYASEANFRSRRLRSVADNVLGVKAAKPLLTSPFAIDAWKGRVLITDASKKQVFLLDLHRQSFAPLVFAGGQSGPPGFPAGVAIIDDTGFFLANSTAARIEKWSFDGDFESSFGADQLTRPVAVAVDRVHRRLAVVDVAAHRLAFFSLDGTFIEYLGERGNVAGRFNFPLDAAFDADGNLFVLDSMNFRVQRFDWDGQTFRFVKLFGELGSSVGSFSRPKSIAVSPSGHVYVTDALYHRVMVFDRDGTFLLSFGGLFIAEKGLFAPGGLYMPNGIAVDDQDGIWVVDSLNRMVHHFQYLNEKYLHDHPIRPGQIAPIDLVAE